MSHGARKKCTSKEWGNIQGECNEPWCKKKVYKQRMGEYTSRMFHIQQFGDWVECTLRRAKHHLQQVKYHLRRAKHHLQRAKHHLQRAEHHLQQVKHYNIYRNST
jgi:hypothetical protein